MVESAHETRESTPAPAEGTPPTAEGAPARVLDPGLLETLRLGRQHAQHQDAEGRIPQPVVVATLPRWTRTRVAIAVWLTKGTPCTVVRNGPLEIIATQAFALAAYVQHSGGLQDPRRIRAYRVVLRAAASIAYRVQQLHI